MRMTHNKIMHQLLCSLYCLAYCQHVNCKSPEFLLSFILLGHFLSKYWSETDKSILNCCNSFASNVFSQIGSTTVQLSSNFLSYRIGFSWWNAEWKHMWALCFPGQSYFATFIQTRKTENWHTRSDHHSTAPCIFFPARSRLLCQKNATAVEP